MKRLADLLYACDAWMLKKYQGGANWIYSKWDTSPFAVAAQMFGICSVLSIIHHATWVNSETSSEWSAVGGPILMAIAGGIDLFATCTWFIGASQKHRAWLKSRPAVSFIDPSLMFLRLWFIVIAPLMILPVIVNFSAFTVMWAAHWAIEVSAFYFASCQPPSYIQRRQQQEVLQHG